VFKFLIYFLTGKKNCHCKAGFENSALIMTNGVRKVRQGLDIFDRRILDSCKKFIISDSALEYGLVYKNLFPAASRVTPVCRVH